MDHSNSSVVKPDFLSDLERLNASLLPQVEPAPPSGFDDFGDMEALGERLSRVTTEVRLRAQRAMARHFEVFPQTPLGTQISLFGTLGFHREEVAHTRALAWLLDSRQPHGFGTSLLDALIGLVCAKAGDEKRARPAKIYTPGVKIVEAEFQLSTRRRIDIFVEGRQLNDEPWRLLIEAKVDAHEGLRQLADYGRLYAEATHLYLTPTGRPPEDAKDAALWISIRFLDVAKAFLEAAPQLVAKPGYGFLQMYLVGVLASLCEIQCPVNGEDVAEQPFAILHLLDKQ